MEKEFDLKHGENLIDELRLLKQYTAQKFKQLEETLEMLIRFARDDLKRIDELNERIRNEENGKRI